MTENQSNKDDFIQKHMHVFAYCNDINQKVAALNLWTNGLRILHGATIIKDFDAYKKIEHSSNKPPDIKAIMPFIENNIIDYTRIITCFENFMKGYLILNNIVVHKLSNKNKSLKSLQNDKPILKTEIFTNESFNNFNRNNSDLWETTAQTINFSWLLKKDYQKIINLPLELCSIIQQFNEKRNKLHFMSLESLEFGNHITEQYTKIIDFSVNVIKPSITNLEKDLNMLRGKHK